MFYSQFILAKKGPLGTIWIAAHLERKLRKNQVADTDIGVSVDSILSPDVPIALRLSSHLLLGVVRIYNRKVNYLFDDCSEALLKVKHAFRSSAVDLPPEESKAPYHSITLPETFDLDDFELPDNDFLQGNYVDHHVGSKDQITLQDTMEGVSYSTSKFGLDERFGDGDASGLDLDEELFLDRFDTAAVVDERGDPQTSGGSMAPLKQNEDFEDRAGNSEPMVDYGAEDTDHMDYAEAPCTPGLMEEPNISNVKEASACDEHFESEDHMEFATKESSKIVSDEEKQEVNNWSSRDDTVLDAVPHVLIVEQNSEANKESSHVSEPVINLLHQAEQLTTTVPELADNITSSSDIKYTEFLQNTTIDINNTCSSPTNKAHNGQGLDEFGLQKGLESTGFISTSQESSDGLIIREPPLLDFDVSGNVENANVQQKSCSELDLGNPVFQENPVTQAFQETTDSHGLILDMHDEASTGAPFLRQCKSRTELQSDLIIKSIDADIQSDIADAASVGRDGTTNQEKYLKENQVQEHVLGGAYRSTSSGQDVHANSTNLQDELVKDRNDWVAAELSAPEKLLSVPEGQTDLYKDMPIEFTHRNFDGLDEGDAGSKTVAGRKRSFTESTLTEQSINSVESSRQVRFKQTTESVPDDDDLLSSILAGRKYSLMKMKPTPLSEVTSTKRTRLAQRSSVSKRKLFMDDTMVLHGDAIRQQLTSTDDIRRVRKKAPCTRPEIAMIKNQHLEDGVFLESIFIGMSVELASLHTQVYDFSRIKVGSNGVIPIVEIMTGNDGAAACESVNNNVIESNAAPLDQADIAEPNEMETMNEPLSALDNEVAEAGEIHPFIESTREEVTCMDTEAIASQDQIKPISNAHEAIVEPLLDVPEVETVLQNGETEVVETLGTIYQDNLDKGDVATDIVQMPNETECADTLDAISNQKAIASQDQIKPISNAQEAIVEPLLDVPEVETVLQNGETEVVETLGTIYQDNLDKGDVATDIVEMPNESECADALDAICNQKDAPATNLRSMDFDDGLGIGGDEVKENGVHVDGEDEQVTNDNMFSEIPHATYELVQNATYGELLDYNYAPNEFYNSTNEEQQHAQEIMLDGGSMYTIHENTAELSSYQQDLPEAEFSGFDTHDQNDLNFSGLDEQDRNDLNDLGTINDTEFLNVDDDELNEMDDNDDDDDVADGNENRITDNSGWSSRTRAVSKYLQTAFVNESERGRKMLSMENLLIGKSRKEASRMFFETLVLKTRDYIHVEQSIPFDDIVIKPRTKMMKSYF